MARVPYLEMSDLSSENQDLLKRRISLFQALVNSPNAARAFSGLGHFIRFGSKLDPRLRELAILRTAITGDCRFEYSQHLKVARTVGIADGKLNAIKSWTTSEEFDPSERAVMAAADELIGRNLVEDATFAALKRYLSDEQIVELFMVIATYRMHGLLVRALHLEFDNDTTSRMEEVPAPSANVRSQRSPA